MLDQLINSLKSEVGGQIASQNNLPEGHLDKVFSVLGDVTTKEVAGHMLKGNLSDVMNLFSDKPNNSGADQLQSNIASVALPQLIKLITRKNSTTPDDDPSPLHELFGGAGGGGLLGEAKNLLGSFLK
jgi:hypothetical protein